MNSLNILSGRASSTHPSNTPRSNSFGSGLPSVTATTTEGDTVDEILGEEKHRGSAPLVDTSKQHILEASEQGHVHGEKLSASEEKATGWLAFPCRILSALVDSLHWLLSTVASPSLYLFSLLCNDEGTFIPFSLLYKRSVSPNNTIVAPRISNPPDTGSDRINRKSSSSRRMSTREARMLSSNSSSSGLSSDSEHESDLYPNSKPNKVTRSKTSQTPDEISPARRSIRIKLHNDDSLRQRNHRKTQSIAKHSVSARTVGEITPATLKSPTSPPSSLSMTKYPRAPAPPRPLVPRRQPSFIFQDSPAGKGGQKTLVLDLDETLIHSMAKGGRMGSGHMVEVKLNTMIGSGAPGPQHPILYYVHKRPHCDEFLRKICKWYNLVIFTASVQEYADPVIDWLEQERKFFSGRFYRQHCTYRHNAFIKDLSSVEPDLSKVMILDNSPLSYMFHQDNAIPIEGWINDPSDNDLLHLVPLLEGLQHVTDVRAFLALRGGEDGKHT